ncbi:hypothetical protein LINGRAHAP2_LOCUS28421 [Linum grandiflorum]
MKGFGGPLTTPTSTSSF